MESRDGERADTIITALTNTNIATQMSAEAGK
jgi:hypothetical protein